MIKPRTYRSDPLRSIHLAMRDLHAVVAVDDATVERLDAACLPGKTMASATDYPLSSPRNAALLLEEIRELEAGKGIVVSEIP